MSPPPIEWGMSDFRKLLVWQKAHALALHADRAASAIRTSRHSSLRSQLVRAAMSIPANIAEGRRQESEREFMRFLRYGVNSACELEYHVMAARDLGALPETESQTLLNELIEVRRMLYGLLNTIKNSQADSHPIKANSPG
jgi:four helix bundle protein